MGLNKKSIVLVSMTYFIRVATPADSTTVVPQYWQRQIVSETQSNIYYTEGNVGLGIPNPLSRLAVDGGATIGKPYYLNTAPTDGLLVSGSVGIGTTSPEGGFHVKMNNSYFNGNIILDSGGIGLPYETNLIFKGGAGDTAGNIFLNPYEDNQDFSIKFKSQNTYAGTIWSIQSDKTALDSENIIEVSGETGLTQFAYDVDINGNTTIGGNLTVNGTTTTINTETIISDQLIINNTGTGSALIVTQTGTESIAEFKDDGVTVFKIVDGGDIGVGTSTPANKLDVVGNIQANKVKLNSGAVAVTPSAGHIEYDGICFQGSPHNSYRGIIPCESSYILKANRLLLNNTTTQNFFPVGITLSAGTSYHFQANIYMTRVAGVVSHNIRSHIGGTATYTTLRYTASATVISLGAALFTSTDIIGATVITAVNAVAAENNILIFDGILCVNVGGTFNLQMSYSAAPGGPPTVQANSWITLKPIGTSTVSTSGDTWA